MFLGEALAAAPQVHAFIALTYYTRGLETGRRSPLPVRHVWDPFVSRPLAIAIALGWLLLFSGLGAFPR
jgi:hypothetical protein